MEKKAIDEKRKRMKARSIQSATLMYWIYLRQVHLLDAAGAGQYSIWMCWVFRWRPGRQFKYRAIFLEKSVLQHHFIVLIARVLSLAYPRLAILGRIA